MRSKMATSLLEMRTSLNDDCLSYILTYIDDFRSFYNFSLTCKQFYKASLWTRNWHLNIVKRKTRFYAARFVLLEMSCVLGVCPLSTVTLPEILRWANISKVMKPTLKNVQKVWASRGPVAAELFVRMSDYKTWRKPKEKGENRPTGYVLDKSVEVLFSPSEEPISIYFTHDESLDCDCLSIQFRQIWGSSKQEVLEFSEYLESWNDDMEEIEPFREMKGYIQREIGTTNPPITAKFLVKSFFLPQELLEINPNVDLADLEQEKPFFLDEARNAKPTKKSLQNTLALLENQPDSFRSFVNVVDESLNIKEINKMVKFVPPSIPMDNFSCYLNICELQQDFTVDSLLKLMLRTSFCPDVRQYQVTEEGQRKIVVEVKASVTLLKGKEATLEISLNVHPGISTSGRIHLPGNDEVIEINVPSFGSLEFHLAQSALEPLQPFTDALKECLVCSPTDNLKLTNYKLWRYFCVMASQDTAACAPIDGNYLCEKSFLRRLR